MNTNQDISGQLKNYIDTADGLTAKNILDMLEIKQTSLWFGNELTGYENEDMDILGNEESQLSLEDIKLLYPDWFNE
jgi:hypothetical protein